MKFLSPDCIGRLRLRTNAKTFCVKQIRGVFLAFSRLGVAQSMPNRRFFNRDIYYSGKGSTRRVRFRSVNIGEVRLHVIVLICPASRGNIFDHSLRSPDSTGFTNASKRDFAEWYIKCFRLKQSCNFSVRRDRHICGGRRFGKPRHQIHISRDGDDKARTGFG